jgi:transposase-like protein
MLTGPELGKAVAEAIRLKGVSKAAVARHFGIKGPSVYDWIDHGRVGKQHLSGLVDYFSDVVGPEHWGLDFQGAAEPSQPAGLDLEMLKSAIVAVKESLRKAELELDAFVAAPVIAFAYQERIKLPRDLPKAKLREFDRQIWEQLQGELAHDAGQGRNAERGQESAEIPAPRAKKTGGRKG